MSTIKEKLTEAINAKNNDVKSFVWKLAKNSMGVQEEVRLIDASSEQLNKFYSHCKSMLYSENKSNPGRYTLLNIIKDQRNKCNAEIFLRKLADGSICNAKYPRFNYCQDILDCIKKNKSVFPQSKLKELPITLITGGIPSEYERLSIATVIDACMDNMGVLDTKHITFSFILNMGIYLTREEMREFTRKDEEGNTRNRLEVVKEELGIKPNVRLTVKPSGLSFNEFRAMVNLRAKKYSELTTDQLYTLRNKVLFRLEQEVNYHIDQWEERIRQIERVAEINNIVLN